MYQKLYQKIGQNLGQRLVQPGTLLNLPEWTETPYFALPQTVFFTVGKELTIYGDSLINVPIDNKLTVVYSCDIGSQSGTKDYVINPVTGDIGSHVLTATFKQSGRAFLTQTINIEVIADTTNLAATVLMVGDSLVYLGAIDIGGAINTAIATNPTFIGTQGTTIKNEGVSGKGFETIIASGSPFYISGALNIAAYFANNSLATPDYVLIRLGVNDCILPGSYTVTDSYITSHIINPAKTLINAFLAFDANLKIIVGLPTICENTGAGWNANYDEATYPQDYYIQNIHRLWGALVTAFDGGTHDARVSISTEAIHLDRNDGYPKTDGVHTNGVHPDSSGYAQLGSGIAPALNYHNSLVPSGLTLSLISGGVKIDWTDNSGGLFETEIWGKNDSDAYALLYTIAAGTVTKSETIDAVDLRYYKIRGKNGTYFTQFTAEQTIAMLGPELVVNGDFSAWTGDNPNNWIVNEGANGYFTEVAGTCRMVVTGSGVSMAQSILTNGAKYRFKVNLITVVSEQLSVVYSSLKYTNFSTAGQKLWYDTTDGTQLIIRRWSGNTDVTFDDVSVKRVLMP